MPTSRQTLNWCPKQKMRSLFYYDILDSSDTELRDVLCCLQTLNNTEKNTMNALMVKVLISKETADNQSQIAILSTKIAI